MVHLILTWDHSIDVVLQTLPSNYPFKYLVILNFWWYQVYMLEFVKSPFSSVPDFTLQITVKNILMNISWDACFYKNVPGSKGHMIIRIVFLFTQTLTWGNAKYSSENLNRSTCCSCVLWIRSCVYVLSLFVIESYKILAICTDSWID